MSGPFDPEFIKYKTKRKVKKVSWGDKRVDPIAAWFIIVLVGVMAFIGVSVWLK